jgi:DNA-binding transcriptional ArsR family regulator
MLPKADWMVPSDAIILLFMSDHRWRFAVTPSVIAMNINQSKGNVNRRLIKMKGAGLVELYDDKGYYRITDYGVRFIMGDLADEEIPEPDVDF